MHRLTAAFACLVSALPWIVISLIDAIFLLVEKHLTPTQRSTNGRDVNKNIFMNQFRPSVCAQTESLELVIFNNEWVFLLIDNNIWTASSEFGTYRLCEQRRFRRACASAQSRQNFAARSYKQWVKRNLQTESQIPGPSEWLGMRS